MGSIKRSCKVCSSHLLREVTSHWGGSWEGDGCKDSYPGQTGAQSGALSMAHHNKKYISVNILGSVFSLFKLTHNMAVLFLLMLVRCSINVRLSRWWMVVSPINTDYLCVSTFERGVSISILVFVFCFHFSLLCISKYFHQDVWNSQSMFVTLMVVHSLIASSYKLGWKEPSVLPNCNFLYITCNTNVYICINVVLQTRYACFVYIHQYIIIHKPI